MRLKRYLMQEWKVHKQFSGRMVKKNDTILWQYFPDKGLLYTYPDGTTFLNNKKIGKIVRADDPKTTHNDQTKAFGSQLGLNRRGNTIEWLLRGRIVGNDLYADDPGNLIGTDKKKYDHMVNKAIDMIYKYIEEDSDYV